MADPITRLNTALEGRYTIERELGEGGMAIVYLADDLKHNRNVALKVLKSELSALVGAERFLAEIRVTANLQHPHILPLFDSGEADGLLFYVMPYVEGESLRDRLDREKQLPVDEALSITTGIASGLHYAHEHGVVHRDVKPANIMLSGGLPVVADFGIALALENAGEGRITGSGIAVGTPHYVSPEQSTGDGPVDARSDLYALACVLYELLTGEPPHTGPTAHAIMAKRLTVTPTAVRTLRTTVPESVEQAIKKALEVVPADRHSSVEAFSRALSDGRTPEPFPQLEALAPASAVAPTATPFVGRARERAELMERLDALGEGQGSLALLGGEPGVGKTRLAEFVLEEARARGYMCVVGHAYELEGTPPFTPFIEQLEYTARVVPARTFRAVLGDAAPEIARIMPALRQKFTDIGPGIELPPDQLRQHLFHRFREYVERAAGVTPLVVLFDDLHWADEGSLLLLEHLAQHLHGMPMLALGTYRDVELEVGRPFAASLERLLRQQRAHRIALRRFPEDEVTEFLAALGGSAPPEALVDTIYHETEGNPFFVQEVFRHLNEEGRLFDEAGQWRADLSAEELDVPEGVRLVVGRRLERVSEGCRKVLTTASVIGPRFALAVLEAVGDVDEEELFDVLEEAEAAQLIQSVGGRRDPVYGFTHELIRQTLIERLSTPRRQRRHLKIASAMEDAYGARLDEHAADVAHHLYQAGLGADPDKTLRFLRLAGDQALAGSGYEEALAQYERALSLEDDVPSELVPVLLEGKMNALDGMGQGTDVIDVGNRAVELYGAIDDTDSVARLSCLIGFRLLWWDRFREAAETMRLALDALSDVPSSHRTSLLCYRGVALNLLDEPGSLESIEQGLSEAEELGDKSAVLYGKQALQLWHYHRGLWAEAARIAEDGLELLEDSADQTTRPRFLGAQANILPSLGRLDEAITAIQEAQQVGRERGDVGAEFLAAFGQLVVTGVSTGDGRQIEAQGQELAEGFHEAGPWRFFGLMFAGLGRFWQGNVEEALVLMDRCADALPEERFISSYLAGWRFRLAAYAGRPGAMSLYEALEPQLFRVGRRAWVGDGFGLHAAIEGLAVLGGVEVAASLYDDAVESLTLGQVGAADGLWACTTGIAAACAAEWEAAEGHFATALRQADEIPHVMAQFDTRRWWAWMLLRRDASGDRERAGELLEEAIAGYRKLEAPLFEQIATEMLGQAGS